MKTRTSLSQSRRNLNVAIACVLAFSLFTMPFVPMTAAMARTAERSASFKRGDKLSTGTSRREYSVTNAPVPKPAPEPMFAPSITATKDDGLAAATTVAPGGTITYTVNVNNNGANSPADDATGVVFSDMIDAHTTLVPGSPVAAASDVYNTIGNVQISVPDGSTDLLGNDFDPDTGNNAGMTATAETKASTNCTGGCTGNVTINANGSFTYDPPLGFSGTDTFTYTANSGGSSATTTVKVNVANKIWFINNNAGACSSNCDGRLSHPFPTLAAFTAANDGGPGHPGDNDWIFVFESSTAYVGPATLRLGQKFIGQDATASLISLTTFTQPSGTDPLPVMNSGNGTIVNITATNVNGINLNSGNLLRGFTVSNVGTGTKISGTSFGTLTVGNNATPDVTLSGTGQALGLTTGTFGATSGFVSVASTSSAAQGVSLAGVGGTVSFGSTTISGSTTQGILIGTTTAAINFGNTSVTGGTDGISFQNNSAGTRTIGTLNVSGSTGNAFVHGAAGGNVTVTGAATLSSGNSAVAVSSPGASNVINFQGATSATSTGAGNTGVNWSGTAGATLTFNSLSIQRNNGTALNATGGGTINITNATGSINNTTAAGAAIIANGVALNANFASINSTGGTNGVGLTNVTGTSNLGGGSLTGTALGPTFLVSGGTTTVTYSGGITQANNAALASIGSAHSAGIITFQTGTLSATAGPGLQFDNADGTYNFNGTTTLNGGDAGIDIANGSSGNFTFASGTTITSPTGAAFNVGTSPGNPTVTFSGSITQNSAARVVNIDGTTGNTITFNTGTLTGGASSTGININNTNGNVTFSNGMTLGTSGARMTNQALTMTNGSGTYSLGAVSIFTTGTAQGIVATGVDGTISSASGTVNSAGANAINIDGPAGLTTLGMILTTVAANGGTNGISIQDTNGSFSVAGTATGTDRCGGLVTVNAVGTPATVTAPVTAECTGGTIQSTTAAGILISNATNISFNRMRIQNPATDGINIATINGFTLNKSFISDSAGVADDKGVDMSFSTGTPINGSINITNSTIGPTPHDNFGATISSGTSTWNVTNTVFDDSQLNSGFNFEIRGTSTVSNFTMDGCVLQGQFADGMQMQPNGTAAATMLANIQNSTFQNNNLGLDLNHDGTSNITYRVINNTFRTHESHAINFFSSAVQAPTTGGTYNGRFEGNIIGTAGTNDSGSRLGNGLRVNINGGADSAVSIINNTVRQTPNGRGIELISRNGTGGLDATVTGNNVDVNFRTTPENGGFGLASIFVQSNCVAVCNTLRSDIRNNTVPAAGPNGDLVAGALGMVETGASTLNLVDTTAPISGTCATELAATNTGSTSASAGCSLIAGPITTVAMLLPLQKVDRGYELAKSDASRANDNPAMVMSMANAKDDVTSFASNVKPVAEFMTRIAVAAMLMPVSVSNAVLGSYNSGSVSSVASEPVTTGAVNSPVTTYFATASSMNSQDAKAKKAQVRSRDSVSHHAKISRAMTPVMSGETVTANIGTLPAGGSVTITFQVTVNNAPNLTLLGPPRVENQGTVTANGGISVLTDDPTVGGATDKTATRIDLFDTSTNLVSNLNPSNFGDSVTFTATVSETPTQASADPTGTVDFIDTSNGNAVVCNDVALSTGSAACTTSSLSPGTHNIRADYSGDGNFDPSQSNIVAQVVIACTPNPIVTSTADSGAGTLREAVANVCSGTTITFNLAGAGPHTITLTTGELPVTKNVTINNNSGESITVSGNNASRVFNINAGKTASIIGLTISGGSAASGAGVLNDGTLTIVNSTLTGNTATSDGGGVGNTATATSLTLINTTVSGNNANGSGGGVVVLGGTMTSINSTVSNNFADADNNSSGTGGGISAQAGTTTLKNTIVAGNFNEDGASDAADDIGGTVDAASSFNLIGTGGAGGLTNGVNNNQVGVANAGLGALADNGGLTRTHALLSTSSAIEAGSNANLPVDTFDVDGDANTAETLPVDQRGTGFPRVADSADANLTQTVDIGAFELHPSIEDIADQSTNEDTVKNVTFNIGDDTGALIATVAATSSNTTLVPNANLVITGSGGSRNLQITPAANQSGTTTITVTVTATNGRTATDTFDLTVGAVNDPPSGTDNTVSTAEDTAYTFTAADFGFTDPNDTPPNTLLAVKITTLPGLGTLTNNNVPVNAGDFIPVADINGGLLKFTPVPNGNGTPYTTFTFQVQDNGGGTDLDPTPNTMTINVTGVNDGPVNTVPGPQSTNEDVALVFSSGTGNQISVADPDAGANPVKITLTATNGTITLSTTAGLAFITGDGTADATMMFTGTLTAVNTALNGMSFTGTANFSGAASLQIVSDDQGNTGSGGPLTDTDSVNITINAVNDPPAGTDNTVSTAEDTAYTFTAADFGFTDPNDTPPNTLLAVKITTLPGLGTLTNNNVAVVAGAFIPVADINGGLLKFTPAADGNGTPYTTFTFQVQDNGGSPDLDPTPNTMTINVTGVNDAPVNTVPGPQSTTEDTPKVFSAANLNQISVADVDAGANPVKITLTATNGTITLSTTAGLVFITGDGTADATMMFTGTLTAVNTALNGMSFTPTPDFNGAASLQIVSDDQGNSGSGGPLTDSDTVNITVNAANDPPVVTTSAGNTSYNENAAATAIDTGLTVTDVDSANLVGATVAITSGFVSAQDTLGFTNQNGINGSYNSGTGVLTLTGSSSVANYQTALRSVTYANSSDNPTTSRTVTFIADDGTSTSAPATKGITINAVNDAPVNVVPGPQGTNQNTPLTFSSGAGNQISVTDVDAGTNAIQVTLTATNGTLTLSGTAGLAFTVGDGTADATMTFTGTIANINTALNGMTYTPNNGFSGAATLTITTNDLGNSGSGGPLSDTDVINIQVSTNVTIQDAQVFEPQSGSTNMIFTVTLSAPAPAGGSSVQFTTVQLAPAINHATAGQDYTTTSGTVNFAVGEQVKTINVPVLSDNKKNESNETFEVQLSNPVNCTISDGTATGTIIETATPGAILISELRTSGPAGAGDDFVEIYNNSDSPHVVNGTGGGYGLFKMGATCSATPVLLGVIPNGTTIPARGHYLFVGSAYSLANYGGAGAAAGDQTMSQDIESDRNVAIFSTGSLVSIGSANRWDAVGFGSNVGATCDLFREGNTLTATNGTPLEHSYFRDECGKKGNPSTFGNCPTGGLTQDSNVNADDFIFADTNATATVMGRRLGAPGPQNLGSPRYTINVVAFLLDSTKGAAGNPNRVRDTTAIGPNAANGTLSIRRRFQNNTGAPVTRLRIRVVDISTTFIAGGGVADLRLLTSGDTTDSVGDPLTCTASGFPSSPCTVTIRGTVLETPPAQPLGGGFNASATTGVITLAQPLAPGASINLQLVLGVQTTGSFKFFFNVEALP